MFRFSLKPGAEEDMFGLWLFVAKDNVAAADRQVDDIVALLGLLAESPDMGRLRPEFAPDIRSFPIGNYVVFYQPTADGIDVLRVLHAARDIEGIMEG